MSSRTARSLDQVVATLKEKGTLVDIAKGELIVAQDSEDDDLYFLIAGSVAIIIDSRHDGARTPFKCLAVILTSTVS